MFELVTTPKPIKTKVEFKYPTDTGEVKKSFFAYFLMISIERYNELLKEGDDEVFFDEVLKDWEGITDEDNNPVKFSTNRLHQLLGNKRIKQALTNKFMEFFHGKEERARKN